MLTRFNLLFAPFTLAAFTVVACTSSPEDAAPAEQAEELGQSLTACHVDSDCVAIPRGGCCSNGLLAAVNKREVRAYEEATKCTANPRPACPSIFVHDTRVALCDSTAKRCKMVAPEDIDCGGLVADPHRCPAGLECSFVGSHPDLPGKCLQP
jgi:hypothetical protein